MERGLEGCRVRIVQRGQVRILGEGWPRYGIGVRGSALVEGRVRIKDVKC